MTGHVTTVEDAAILTSSYQSVGVHRLRPKPTRLKNIEPGHVIVFEADPRPLPAVRDAGNRPKRLRASAAILLQPTLRRHCQLPVRWLIAGRPQELRDLLPAVVLEPSHPSDIFAIARRADRKRKCALQFSSDHDPYQHPQPELR